MKNHAALKALIQKTSFLDIRHVALDRTTPSMNPSRVRKFADETIRRMKPFQDADVILLALTVNHKESRYAG